MVFEAMLVILVLFATIANVAYARHNRHAIDVYDALPVVEAEAVDADGVVFGRTTVKLTVVRRGSGISVVSVGKAYHLATHDCRPKWVRLFVYPGKMVTRPLAEEFNLYARDSLAIDWNITLLSDET